MFSLFHKGYYSTHNHSYGGFDIQSSLDAFSYSKFNKAFSEFYEKITKYNNECDSSDSIVLLGTTNKNSAGSSANLTLDNATVSLIGDGDIDQDGVVVTHSTSYFGYSQTSVSVSEWNLANYKEVKIDNSDDYIHIDGVVDFDITNSNRDGVNIDIDSAKRGQINTSSGDDVIDLDVYSNNSGWVNSFTVSTGDGNDSLKIYDNQSTSYASLDIDMGNGNDVVDISGLSSVGTSAVSRVIDGGNGLDVLMTNSVEALTFENFEVVQSLSDEAVSLTVDSELLSNNGDSKYGLVLSNFDIEFSDDIQSVVESRISYFEARYLDSLGVDHEDYTQLLVTTIDGDSYSVFTTDETY